jgi:hypothetical protein
MEQLRQLRNSFASYKNISFRNNITLKFCQQLEQLFQNTEHFLDGGIMSKGVNFNCLTEILFKPLFVLPDTA